MGLSHADSAVCSAAGCRGRGRCVGETNLPGAWDLEGPGLVSGSLPRTSSSERLGRPSQSWPVARSVTAGTTVHARGTPTNPRSRRPSPAANDPRAHSLSGKSLKSQGGPSAGSFPGTPQRELTSAPSSAAISTWRDFPIAHLLNTHTHTLRLWGVWAAGNPVLVATQSQ